MAVSTLRRKINRVIADPSLILVRLRQAMYPGKTVKKKPSNIVSITLSKRLDEIESHNHVNVLVFSDANSAHQARQQLGKDHVVWMSSDFSCLENGAQSPLDVDISTFDAILVAGPNVTSDYRYILRSLDPAEVPPALYWASDGFEFCGGTVPIAIECEDSETTIYNHFADMFGVWDPLYVRIEVFDQETTIIRWKIVRPGETFCVRLSEWLPNRKGPACIYHSCQHPRLTNQRHYRWRSTTVYHWHDSAAMVHGDHDFRNSAAVTEFKLGCALVHSGKLVFTLPNYEMSLKDSDRSMETLSGQEISQTDRRVDVRIDELSFDKKGNATFDEFYGGRYSGSGGSFWFALDDGEGLSHKPSIAANHTARSYLRPLDGVKNPPGEKAFTLAKQLEESGILLDPHGVPVTMDDSPIEFGFEFDANVPSLLQFNVRLHAPDGAFIAEAPFTKSTAGPVFTSEIMKVLGWESEIAGLMIVCPDWLGMGADPIGRGAIGNLVARHRKTHDLDATEFQNCWRNVGVRINELPHWLSQDRMLTGGTNLLCGISGAESNTRVALSLLNGSGNMAYNTMAQARLSLIAPDGHEYCAQITLKPFECTTVWLDDVMPQWRDYLDTGFGTVLVKSGNADLNANLVTVWNDRAVSLQHMWGY